MTLRRHTPDRELVSEDPLFFCLYRISLSKFIGPWTLSIIPVAPAKNQEKKHGHVLVDVEFEGMDYTTIIRWNIKMNIEYMNK